MTKLIVASDSHGSAVTLQGVLDKERDADALLFLGDGVRDLDTACGPFPGLRVYAVRGNCDLAALEPPEGVAPFDGVNVLYTHGHLYGVKSGLERLWYAARERGAYIIAVTKYGPNPLAELADCVLPTSSPELEHRSGATSSRLAALFVVDVLYTTLCNKNYDTVEKPLTESYSQCRCHHL